MKQPGTISTRARGAAGEEAAADHLKLHGYRIIERNYFYNRGEIDVIAYHGRILVFIEVKSRRSAVFGPPEESVTPKKQELIRRTAEGYVMERGIIDTECRFDVVSIVMKDGKPQCTILKNCF